MRKRLRKTCTESFPLKNCAGVHNAFDIVGDIAIIKTPNDSAVNVLDIAGAIMNRHKNVKAVFAQNTKVHGDFRLRGLTHLTGEKRTSTIHKESGCSFKVDLEKCYFSPRLSGERMRTASLVESNETVVNMFAGVGCFSIILARQVPTARVYSIDINPVAVQYMTENVRLNRVYGKVIPMLGDSKSIIQNQLGGCADRVLMPLPERALEYLPHAVSALKPSGGWLHVHTFEHAAKGENPSEKAKQKLEDALEGLGLNFGVAIVRIVRKIGPNWFQLVTDVQLSPLDH